MSAQADLDLSSYNFVSLNDALQELKDLGQSNEIAIFVGAGICVAAPSSCPTWSHLIEMSMTAAVQAHPALDSLYARLANRLPRLKPELLCQLLHANLHSDFFGFLDILNFGQPNGNHHALASLAAQGTKLVILTTNFDTYIERAFRSAGIRYDLFVNKAPHHFRQRALRNRPTSGIQVPLVKLHGSLDERASMVLTLRQAALRLKRDLATFLKNVFNSFPVLIVGYSGNDDDIFPVIMEHAASAPNVFWALRENEKGLTGNIKTFAWRRPNIKLVRAECENVLEKLADWKRGERSQTVEVYGDRTTFLRRWAAGISEAAWTNFFCEVMLSLDPSADDAAIVADQTSRMDPQAMDLWQSAKAFKNNGLALAILGESENALATFSAAINCFRQIGRYREVVEVLVLGVTRVLDCRDWSIMGMEPQFLAHSIAGRTYEAYTCGLANLASGVFYWQGRRIELAKERLSIAAGYAIQSGDRLTLRNSLEYLGKVFEATNEPIRAEQCRQKASEILQALGTTNKRVEGEIDNTVFRMCEAALAREIRKLVIGEVGLFLVMCVISTLLAWFVIPWAWLLAVFYVVRKLWNTGGKFRLTSIEQS